MINNCFSNMEISSSEESSIGGIAGTFDTMAHITNCFYVAGSGRSTSYETSVGAATLPNGSVFSTDGTTLLYTGTLCEVLNAYRLENDTDNSYKVWVEGSDSWPAFED